MPGSRLSQTEQKLKGMWSPPPGQPFPSLTGLSIKGTPGLRGIVDLNLEFKYPLSVICGRNGVGKSTILALAALAFQPPSGHLPLNAKQVSRGAKKHAHYTFADFFFKGPGDPDVSGVSIDWRFTGDMPIKSITKQSEKWMRYESRPIRPMHFIGLARAVHPIEQRVLRWHFKDKGQNGIAQQLSASMLNRFSEIIGKTYQDAASLLSARESRLRTCKSGSAYSGFNMGSGEDIVLGILSLIENSPPGTLIIIEELEVGLFQQAQGKLIEHLLELAVERKLQIIVSSHSEIVIDRVPRESRILIQGGASGERDIIYGPTTRMALGNMFGVSQPELTVVCEDAFAAVLCSEMLSHDLKKRVAIQSIGSCSEIGKATAYAYKVNPKGRYLMAWDGEVPVGDIKKWLREECCKGVFDNQSVQGRVKLCRLPGENPPERVAIGGLDSPAGIASLVHELNCTSGEAEEIIRQCRSITDEHDIPYQFFQLSGCENSEAATRSLCKAFNRSNPAASGVLNALIAAVLANQSHDGIQWDQVYGEGLP